jgi:hypothetical protein
MKLSVNNPSLIQMALTSQGSLRQGSGTVYEEKSLTYVQFRTVHSYNIVAISLLLVQLNPSPTVNGAWHKQLKLPLNKLSLTQSALGSQGIDKHGSGTDHS